MDSYINRHQSMRGDRRCEGGDAEHNPHPLPAGTFPLLRGKKYHRGPLVDRLRQVPSLGVASTMKNPDLVGGRGVWEGAVTPTMPRIQQHANVNGNGEPPIT